MLEIIAIMILLILAAIIYSLKAVRECKAEVEYYKSFYKVSEKAYKDAASGWAETLDKWQKSVDTDNRINDNIRAAIKSFVLEINEKNKYIRHLEAKLHKRRLQVRELDSLRKRVSDLSYENMKLRARLYRDWDCQTCNYRQSFGHDLVPIPEGMVEDALRDILGGEVDG